MMKSHFRWGLLMILAGLVYACNKDDAAGPPTSLSTMGSNVTIDHADTSLVLKWEPGLVAWEGAERPTTLRYAVQISQDSTFEDESQNVFDFETDSTSFFLGDQELVPLERYFARVRTVTSTGTGFSSWSNTDGFELRPINIWKPIKVGNLSDAEAILNWRRHGELTNLVVSTKEGTPVGEFNVKDATAVSQLLEGLSSNHEYVAELFRFDGRSLGTLAFTTKPTVEEAGYKYVENPAELETTLNTLPDGAIIALKRGVSYPISSTKVLDRSVTILSEPGLSSREPQATIKMSASFDVTGTVDLIKFEDVAITGSMSSTNIFNLDAPSTINQIEFEACVISDQRGLLHMNAGAGLKTVNKYVINNSRVQNIKDYGVLTIEHTDAKVNDVMMTNSSFINNNYIIRYNPSYVNTLNSLRISDATFFNAPNGDKYVVDMSRTGSIIGSLNVANTLFGYTTGARSFNRFVPNSISATNSFATSDSKWGTSATQALVQGVQRYSGASSSVFANPDTDNFANSDLTIIDEALQGVGDPRWRP